jgi:hypothetical protein
MKDLATREIEVERVLPNHGDPTTELRELID